MKNCWKKTPRKDIWKNDKEGRWVGIAKPSKGKFRFYTIKNGYITHGTFNSKKEAMSKVKTLVGKC